MIRFLVLSLPIFGVIALGWAMTRRRLTTMPDLDALGGFSLRFALPALVLHLIGNQPLGSSFNPRFYAAYLGSGLAVFGAVFLLARSAGGRSASAAAANASTATVSNLGFLGPPLMLAYFGVRGAGPLTMAILAEVMVLLTIGGVVMAAASGEGDGLRSVLIRGTVLNPLAVAIVVGGVCAATGVRLPPTLDRWLALLGGAAAPTALFALGGTLAIRPIDRPTISSALALAGAKLVLAPALLWVVLAVLLHEAPIWVQAGVVLASLPSASSSYLLARRYAPNAEAVSAAIALSTIVGAVTVPLTASLVIR